MLNSLNTKLLQLMNGKCFSCNIFSRRQAKPSVHPSTWYYSKHLFIQSDDGLFDSIDWEVWFHSPGMPPVVPQYVQYTCKLLKLTLMHSCIHRLDTTVSDVCTALADKWTKDEEESFSPNDLSELSSTQIQEFLNQLLNKVTKFIIDKNNVCCIATSFCSSFKSYAEDL